MEPILKGWLIKSPPEQKASGHWRLFGAKWKRRFFVLYAPPLGSGITDYKGAMLEYYTSKKLNTKVGFINLDDCDEILSGLDSDTYKHVFGLQTKHKGKNRTYYLVSETEDEMNRWVNHLCRVLGLLENEECRQPLPPPPRVPGMNVRMNSEPNLIENTHDCFVSPQGKASVTFAELANDQRLRQAGSVPDFDSMHSSYHHSNFPPPRSSTTLPPIPPEKTRKSLDGDMLEDKPSSDQPPPKPPKNRKKKVSNEEGTNSTVNKVTSSTNQDADKSPEIEKRNGHKSTSSTSTLKDHASDEGDDMDEKEDGEYHVFPCKTGEKSPDTLSSIIENLNQEFYDVPNKTPLKPLVSSSHDDDSKFKFDQEFYDTPPLKSVDNNNNETKNNDNNYNKDSYIDCYDVPSSANKINNEVNTESNKKFKSFSKPEPAKRITKGGDDFYDVPTVNQDNVYNVPTPQNEPPKPVRRKKLPVNPEQPSPKPQPAAKPTITAPSPNQPSSKAPDPAPKKTHQFGSKHKKLVLTGSLGSDAKPIEGTKPFPLIINNSIRFTQRSRSFKRSFASNGQPQVRMPTKKISKQNSTSSSSSISTDDDDDDDAGDSQ